MSVISYNLQPVERGTRIIYLVYHGETDLIGIIDPMGHAVFHQHSTPVEEHEHHAGGTELRTHGGAAVDVGQVIDIGQSFTQCLLHIIDRYETAPGEES